VSGVLPQSIPTMIYTHTAVTLPVKVGSDTTPIAISGGTLSLDFAVNDTSIPVGSVVQVFRSNDGISWKINTPISTCIVTTTRMCSIQTDHLSYFSVVYSSGSMVSGGSSTTNTTTTSYTSISNGLVGGGGSMKTSLFPGLLLNKVFPTAITGISLNQSKESILDPSSHKKDITKQTTLGIQASKYMTYEEYLSLVSQ